MRGGWAVPLALLAAVGLLVAVLSWVTVRTDMAEFLPAGQTEGGRVLVDQVRSGAAAGLVLVGVEGGDVGELARVAGVIEGALPGTGLFDQVVGGGSGAGADAAFLFAHRYALSPGVTAASFEVGALRAGLERVLGMFRSAAGGMATEYGLGDPTGAFVALLQVWAGGSRVRVVEGAWVSADGGRALLLARTRAGGMDVAGQEVALGAISQAFAGASPAPGVRLVMAGPAVFARDAARAIRGDVERISVVSTVLVVGLLWWRFRSLLVLAAVAAPVVASVAVAALVVQGVFGSVHGVALGFGATMLGVSVDYPVLLIGHRKRGEAPRATRARIGRAFGLAVGCALLGLLPMVGSAFPGLRQLGVFAAVGVGACGVLTAVVLPRLVVWADLAPVAAGDLGWVRRLEGVRAWRWWGVLPVLGAVGVLLGVGVRWEGDLQALSPVPAASLALDQAMRADVGAGDAGHLVVVRGGTADAVLVGQERLIPVLDGLQAAGVVRGAEMAARFLPSAGMQAGRLAVLPEAGDLAARVEAARAGLPFRAEALVPFEQAVAAAKVGGVVRLEDLAGVARARVGGLLGRRGDEWVGVVALDGVSDPGRVAAGVAAAGFAYVDVRAELGSVLRGAVAGAWWWLGGSGVGILLVLGVGLRDGRVWQVVGAIGSALVVTVAVLAVAGVAVSPIHLVALQLVAGIGLDYALFFARRQLDLEERARTVRTLVTCNAMTLLTFGLAVDLPDSDPARHWTDGGRGRLAGDGVRIPVRGGGGARTGGSMTPLILTACTAVSALGAGAAAHRAALLSGVGGLRANDFEPALGGWIGRVDGVEGHALPPRMGAYDCRNNRLADMALQSDGFAAAVGRAVARYGAERIAVVLGTSTSGVSAAEQAYRQRGGGDGPLPNSFDYEHTQDLYSVAGYVRAVLGLRGPALVISTACASTSRCFLDASQLMAAGVCDAAVVGGADSLCRMTLHGFAALELLSPVPCRPCGAERTGISVGEAAGVRAAGARRGWDGVPGRGGRAATGTTCRARIRRGPGAVAAMRGALAAAGVEAGAVDWVKLHGTGTRANDAMEDRAVCTVFGGGVACSSTKAWTGHTLGACGILEALMIREAMAEGVVPGCLGIEGADPAFGADVAVGLRRGAVRVVVSNAFGFGGINCALVFGDAVH